MKTIQDVAVSGRRVLIRPDVNAPLQEDGSLQDDFRLLQSVPTVLSVAERGGVCVIIGHLGRPKGREEGLSLRPVAKRFGELLGREVRFLPDCVGEEVEQQVRQLAPGDVAMAENLRFHEGETANDPTFAKALARLGDLYVNDAFGACHRAHASMVGVPRYLPSVAGLLLIQEVEVLGRIRENPERPMVVIVGGTKVSTKTSFLDEMSKAADTVLTGNPVYQEIQEKGLRFRGSEKIIPPRDGIPSMREAFDIGPETVALYQEKLKGAKTVFWAGPLGKVEEEEYAKGSLAVAKAIGESSAFSVAGGGDLAAFLGKHHLREKFDHVSTGGGAMLAFLAGEELPGLKALEIARV